MPLAASVVAPYALDALGLTTVNPFVSGLILGRGAGSVPVDAAGAHPHRWAGPDVPVALLAVRTVAMVALITAPVMLGGSPLYSFAIAGVAFVFLRGTFNMDEMKAQQDQLNREKEAAKKRSGQKIKVQRPGR